MHDRVFASCRIVAEGFPLGNSIAEGLEAETDSKFVQRFVSLCELSLESGYVVVNPALHLSK